MKEQPLVTVHPPDERGLREVSIEGRSLGRAWSLRDLRAIIHRAGLPKKMDFEDQSRVRWIGGGVEVWPHRRWRRRTMGFVTAVGFIVTSAVVGRIGLIDAFRALTYGGRVAGVSFIVASIVEMLAVVATFDYWRKRYFKHSGLVVLIGTLVAFAVNLLLLVVHLYGGEYTHYLWLWPILLAWSLWSLWMLHRQNIWREVLHPKGVAAGVVASTLLAVANLAYSQVYLPYATTSALPLQVEFGKPNLNENGEVLHVPTRIRYKNSGKVRLYVLGGMWRIYGLSTKFSEKARNMDDWKRDITPPYELDFRRNSVEDDWDLVDSGGFSAPGDWLEPGDDFKHERLVEIPANSKFQIVHADLELAVVRGDRGTLDPDFADSWKVSWNLKNLKHEANAPEWVADPGDEYVRYQSRLYYSSEILNVTRKGRYVTTWRVIPNFSDNLPAERDDTDPYIVAIIALPGKEGEYENSEQRKIAERFGMSFVYGGSAIQVSFPGLVNSAKGK
ncbi:hypothetical protein ACIF8T_22050 [Streptomyces sp. NPDC085946]|uniref:hypothetical protein n=1 Tax=Streptomyces sp. NPDC085946 TaxID=3365744 RepID=UPI0037D52C3E